MELSPQAYRRNVELQGSFQKERRRLHADKPPVLDLAYVPKRSPWQCQYFRAAMAFLGLSLLIAAAWMWWGTP